MVSEAIVSWQSGACAQYMIVAPSRAMLLLAVAVLKLPRIMNKCTNWSKASMPLHLSTQCGWHTLCDKACKKWFICFTPFTWWKSWFTKSCRLLFRVYCYSNYLYIHWCGSKLWKVTFRVRKAGSGSESLWWMVVKSSVPLFTHSLFNCCHSMYLLRWLTVVIKKCFPHLCNSVKEELRCQESSWSDITLMSTP